MSYDIKSTPAIYSSFNDDLVYCVLDAVKVADPTTYPNFRYIGDVYVDGTLVARVKKIPDPATGIGIFNVGQIVRNYVAMAFNPAAGLVSQEVGDGEFNLSVEMHFGYDYGFTDYIDVTIDTPRIFFNNYNRRQYGTTSSLTAVANLIASNCPLYGSVLFSSPYYFISFFPTTTTPVALVVTPTGGGAGYSTTFTASNAYDLQVLNISPGGLNAVHPGTIGPGCTSYMVQIGAQVFVMQVICEAQYTPYTLHFLNQYGGFDTKIFSKVSRKSYDIAKTDFGKLPFTVDSNGIVSYRNANGVYNETRSVYASQLKEKAELNSDFITDAEYVWLADLVMSPMVYLEDGGYFYPVVISETNYELKKTINDDLTSINIKIEFGQNLNAQFR